MTPAESASRPPLQLERDGCALFPSSISATRREELRKTVFQEGVAGTRCLLDVPVVNETARHLLAELREAGVLPAGAVAVQAIAFDKTPSANWKVTWHQDVMFPFAAPVSHPGFEVPSVKDGVPFARPPREVLEEMLAVRLHLDDCDLTNGPLRVSPGTHALGILKGAEVADRLAAHGEHTCLAAEGEAVLMRPLLLHASSQATAPKHRRVLHVVYHSGRAIPETWHRRVI